MTEPDGQEGVVLSVEGGKARVRMERPKGCGRCRLCREMEKDIVAEVEAPTGIRPGDRVRLTFDPRGVWRGTFWVFVLPLAGLVGGAVLGCRSRWIQETLGLGSEAASGLCGLVFLAIAFAASALRNRRLERSGRCRMRILGRV